jgi:hypothetical protein
MHRHDRCSLAAQSVMFGGGPGFPGTLIAGHRDPVPALPWVAPTSPDTMRVPAEPEFQNQRRR